MSGGTVVGVDLGATSGRVLLGHIHSGRVSVEPLERFENRPVRTSDGLHWNVLELYRQVLEGLTLAARRAPAPASVGIDSWAVDYALMRQGRMLSTPYSYRDERNAPAAEAAHALVGPAELYARNGLQHLPFNTLFQLTADRLAGTLALADTMLLVPDLLGYWLTGRPVAERTNASTTGLLGIHTNEWDTELAGRLGLNPAILPPLVDPGVELGGLAPHAARIVDSTATRVVAVGSHDTASAVAAIPATSHDMAYVSCGTWSLVGVELATPVLSDAGRAAGFTNERGVDGRIRYLHNVMGLWLLSESIRDWEHGGDHVDLAGVLAAAADLTDPVPVFDADDQAFLAPGDMPARIEAWLRTRDLPVPSSRPALVRTILESLAASYGRAIRAASELSGVDVRVVHMVGGGSQNTLLCQLTANATGRPVLAGPAEATAIGNVLVQARALGWIAGSLEALRALVARDFPVVRYEPQ